MMEKSRNGRSSSSQVVSFARRRAIQAAIEEDEIQFDKVLGQAKPAVRITASSSPLIYPALGASTPAVVDSRVSDTSHESLRVVVPGSAEHDASGCFGDRLPSGGRYGFLNSGTATDTSLVQTAAIVSKSIKHEEDGKRQQESQFENVDEHGTPAANTAKKEHVADQKAERQAQRMMNRIERLSYHRPHLVLGTIQEEPLEEPREEPPFKAGATSKLENDPTREFSVKSSHRSTKLHEAASEPSTPRTTLKTKRVSVRRKHDSRALSENILRWHKKLESAAHVSPADTSICSSANSFNTSEHSPGGTGSNNPFADLLALRNCPQLSTQHSNTARRTPTARTATRTTAVLSARLSI